MLFPFVVNHDTAFSFQLIINLECQALLRSLQTGILVSVLQHRTQASARYPLHCLIDIPKSRVGQNPIYTMCTAVYFKNLPTIPYIHRIYMILAKPNNMIPVYDRYTIKQASHAEPPQCPFRYQKEVSALQRMQTELQASSPDTARLIEAAVQREQAQQVGCQ